MECWLDMCGVNVVDSPLDIYWHNSSELDCVFMFIENHLKTQENAEADVFINCSSMTVHLPFVVLSRDVQLHTSLFSVSISLSLLLSLSTISRQNKLSWKKHVICLFCKTHTTHKFTMHTLTCSPFGKKSICMLYFIGSIQIYTGCRNTR